jgi:hypothetical protein
VVERKKKAEERTERDMKMISGSEGKKVFLPLLQTANG